MSTNMYIELFLYRKPTRQRYQSIILYMALPELDTPWTPTRHVLIICLPSLPKFVLLYL